ncbi:aldehyde dehydrogenase family protein [Nocardia sp. NPDC051463]|uniref:aldehyde dehydrogenase family protein n=1 Tax=Nocardia sp. NPDC051463 TaxID=3154845 RepID=UPI00344C7CB7
MRRDRLDRLVLLLTDNAAAFSEALDADFGNRPQVVNYLSDIAGILPDIAFTRARLGTWMKPRRVLPGAALAGLDTVVEKKPLGVVGIIGPWNFPIGLIAQPAASAFAAGNRVMLKFSEVTPRTAELFAARAAQYFTPEELVVVTGGADVGAEFSALPFDHLFFTGSPAVGALVASAAGANLVPVTLELGGKNPAVIGPDADIARSADRLMSARLVNGGQLCLCPEYVFVPRAATHEFIDEALKIARRILTSTDGVGLVSMVNDKNFDRVVALIDDAEAKGAAVFHANSTSGEFADRVARRIDPTILLGVTDDMTIAHNEVFGPVLAIHPYDTVDEIIDYVVARPSPLAAYWFGRKDRNFQKFRSLATSGGMTVNDCLAHCVMMTAPFGGVGRSGFGAYHGKAGFDTFTHHRTITTNRLPLSFATMLVPPFSGRYTSAIGKYILYTQKKALSRRRRAAQRTPRAVVPVSTRGEL